MGQETLILPGEIYLRPEVTYDCRYDDFRVTHTCSTAMCQEFLCRISLKFDSMFFCWYEVTDEKADLKWSSHKAIFFISSTSRNVSAPILHLAVFDGKRTY
jgi:hypothetical protein